MASTATLKELARAIVKNRGIADAEAHGVIERLPRADLRRLLLFLRLEVKLNRVTVTTAEPAGDSLRARIGSVYAGLDAVYAVDPSLGGGIRVEHGDDITDITVKGSLERTYQQIKERL